MAGIATMQGVSRESFATARRGLNSIVNQADVPSSLGGDLFAMARNINSVVTLRRVLTDPNGAADEKAHLVQRIFGGKVDDRAVDLVGHMVGLRWAAARDLVDAVEAFGTDAVLAQADRAGRLDTVEDEVFRFSRIVAADAALQQALTDRARSADDKAALLDRLLDGRACEQTRLLVRQAVVDPRGRRLDQAFEEYERAIAARRQENLAFVTSASPLTAEQADRLTASLSRIYGASVHLNFDIDPNLVGGVVVRVGDDVIDGSIRTRLDDAARRLAG